MCVLREGKRRDLCAQASAHLTKCAEQVYHASGSFTRFAVVPFGLGPIERCQGIPQSLKVKH